MVQFSHPYMTTGKIIALTIWTFVGKMMSLALGPGALGRARGIRWTGRWEGGSGWGIHVNPWLIHVNV